MHLAYRGLLASLVFCSGCSVFIARTGAKLNELTTREQVHQKFGKPTLTGVNGEDDFEVFQTRRKIAHDLRAAGYGMGFAMTFGLTEFIGFPREIYCLGTSAVLGQQLRFEYDSTGRITNISLDDEEFLLDPAYRRVDLFQDSSEIEQFIASESSTRSE